MPAPSPELEASLDSLESGLRMLGRDRTVVLSQHHGFELIEQMQGELAKVRRLAVPAKPAAASPTEAKKAASAKP